MYPCGRYGDEIAFVEKFYEIHCVACVLHGVGCMLIRRLEMSGGTIFDNGISHNCVWGFLGPRRISLPLKKIQYLSFSNVKMHP